MQTVNDTQGVGKVLDQVVELAAMADITMGRHPEDDETLVAGFELGNGRRQSVFVRYVGQSEDGSHCVSFMSPCMSRRRRRLSIGDSFGGRRAIDLLRRNAALPFGNFALQRFEDEDVLVVQSSQIVETMEIEELRAHVLHVALIADAYEMEHGRDDF